MYFVLAYEIIARLFAELKGSDVDEKNTMATVSHVWKLDVSSTTI